MLLPENETAIRSAKSDGGDAETICGGFEGKTYGGAFVGSIPSAEHAGRIAMVVRRDCWPFAGTILECARGAA
ncbi:hypothetical protein [Aureimonas leprariae]|uniref:Uncharacterized protein n=1 Tax=Plantimonas leprariae TaxID=2615207 RepID=A0A7V7TUC1_9HYPH|nr:hypothetical protein [Aureimonas leprariae]KAB0676003.1 hypothetical protein F6X38_22335 [Aureimonas leprariae]